MNVFYLVCVCVLCSVMYDSLQQHKLEPTSLLCPYNFPGKNTGVGCHFLLQGIFPIQGLNPRLLHLGHWQADWVTWNLRGELAAHTSLYLCFVFPLNVTKWRKVWSILKRFSFQFLHHFYDIYFAHISIMKPYEYINILIEIKPTILENTWKKKILLTVFCRIAICKTPSSSDISTDTGKINTEWWAEVQCLNWSCAAKQYFPVCSCSWSVISVTSNSL